MADFRAVVSVLPCSPTNKGKKNLCGCAEKANRQWAFVAFWLSWYVNIKTAAAFANWLAPKTDALFSLIYFFGSFCVYYIPHIYVIAQAMPHAIPQTHSVFYPHRFAEEIFQCLLYIGRSWNKVRQLWWPTFLQPNSTLFLMSGLRSKRVPATRSTWSCKVFSVLLMVNMPWYKRHFLLEFNTSELRMFWIPLKTHRSAKWINSKAGNNLGAPKDQFRQNKNEKRLIIFLSQA